MIPRCAANGSAAELDALGIGDVALHEAPIVMGNYKQAPPAISRGPCSPSITRPRFRSNATPRSPVDHGTLQRRIALAGIYLGRKSTYTRQQSEKVRDMLGQETAGIAHIANETGLARQTVYRIKNDPVGAETALAAWAFEGAWRRPTSRICLIPTIAFCQVKLVGSALRQNPTVRVMATHSPTFRPACAEQTVRIDHSPLASSHFDGRLPWVDGRFPWVAWRRTNMGCPRDRALLSSRSAILPRGSLARRKLTEGRKDRARWARRVAGPRCRSRGSGLRKYR
jgi:Helix-turn-helix domain of resolvase